ncbi:hypothetical protein ACERZ8_00265 [Tateyamaria armeniaca]|uniref:Uncharacterized protein n=1 Tax=Tateyamaria armeniaca TaxID=2518930 RepID=A0ABW8UNR8_9RHOB
MAELDRARLLERTYERRAARTRRAKWLGGVLFSLSGMALTLTLMLNPDLASRVVEWSHGTHVPSELLAVDEPTDIHVRSMPRDVVPVRRGSLPGSGSSP